jgi:hypothetical protein
MKQTYLKLIGLAATFALTLCSFGVYAEEAKEETGKLLDDKGMEIEGNVQKMSARLRVILVILSEISRKASKSFTVELCTARFRLNALLKEATQDGLVIHLEAGASLLK